MYGKENFVRFAYFHLQKKIIIICHFRNKEVEKHAEMKILILPNLVKQSSIPA